MNNPPFDPALADRLRESRIIAVLAIDRDEDAVPLAEALLEGGVDALELTLRTPVAVSAMETIIASFPELNVGIGTILSVEQLYEVSKAGADFGVAPGMNPRIIREAAKLEFSFAPGVATPSEVEEALEFGCRLLKFFPAEPSGGLDYLKSMAAPYAHLGVQFIPLGGINPSNLSKYLGSPLVAAIGGSWIASRDLINAQDWTSITNNAREAREITTRHLQDTV
jgi:2-dehydro-3-deoxyphosphogluconate aldolase/(4S)-4-hydroxy-2-oxoglutarate aldolase